MLNRVTRNDQTRLASFMLEAIEANPEQEELSQRIEILKKELPTFELLMEQIGNYYLLPEHLRKEADAKMGIKKWALVPIFNESPANKEMDKDFKPAGVNLN